MEGKSPSFCRLCNVALASPSVWRQHAKSDWHVYNLRLKVAEPGAVITPPPASPRTAGSVDAASKASSAHSGDRPEQADDEHEGDKDLSEEPEFIPEECLFCGVESESFDHSLAHMFKTHSFSIPYQEHLTVDPEMLVGYLHLVIHGYGECIQCASRRSTVEGIQHHMVAKGHCRFNVASDIAEFYDLPEQDYHADDESLRLPSGKVLNHRTRTAGSVASRIARHTGERRPAAPSSALVSRSRESELATTQDGEESAPPAASTQLSRLTRGDQQSLAHLPDNQVRSLLAISAKHIDRSRRQEKQAQLKIEKAENTILMGGFRMDTSKRFRGSWG